MIYFTTRLFDYSVHVFPKVYPDEKTAIGAKI